MRSFGQHSQESQERRERGRIFEGGPMRPAGEAPNAIRLGRARHRP